MLALDGEMAVGFVIFGTNAGLDGWDGGDALGEIREIAVLRSHRRRGLGSMLVDRARRRLAEQGITELQVSAMAANSSAIDFYRRRGFAVTNVTLMTEIEP